MKGRVLVVEDIKGTLDDLVSLINDIKRDDKKRHGINSFQIAKARSVSEAVEQIRTAGHANPFDLITLDLGLPIDTPNAGETYIDAPENGMRVLSFLRENAFPSQVIVHSVYTHYKYVKDVFRLGAVDFVAKEEEVAVLQKAVLAAWDRLLAVETVRTMETRFKTLVPFAEKALAHWFSGCFSQLIQSVAHEVEAAENNVTDRLGLDVERDKNDPLMWHLLSIENSLAEAKEEWSILQTNLSGFAETSKEIVIEAALKAAVKEVLPCLTLKRAETFVPEGNSTRVLCFSDDVPTILKELLIGGLIDEPDRSGLNEDSYVSPLIKIEIRQDGPQVELRFEDNLKPVEPAEAASINSGQRIAIDGSFGRVWGLTVAQHVALRGGGRLVVHSSKKGNVISYFIPLAN